MNSLNQKRNILVISCDQDLAATTRRAVPDNVDVYAAVDV